MLLFFCILHINTRFGGCFFGITWRTRFSYKKFVSCLLHLGKKMPSSISASYLHLEYKVIAAFRIESTQIAGTLFDFHRKYRRVT